MKVEKDLVIMRTTFRSSDCTSFIAERLVISHYTVLFLAMESVLASGEKEKRRLIEYIFQAIDSKYALFLFSFQITTECLGYKFLLLCSSVYSSLLWCDSLIYFPIILCISGWLSVRNRQCLYKQDATSHIQSLVLLYTQ